MNREHDVRTVLQELEVPEHGPRFWEQWEARLQDKPSPRRRWKVALGASAAAVAAALVLLTISPTALTPSVLAYSFPEGIFSYQIEYREAHETRVEGEGPIEAGRPTRIEFEGLLTYLVEEGPDPDTVTLTVRASASDPEIECGHPDDCPEDRALFQDIPEIRLIVERDGELVRFLPSDSEKGIPLFVLPDALPGSNLYGGMPFGFGPPFPERVLDVGDTWSISGPRYAFGEDIGEVTAQHRVVREEDLVGRRTLVIESTYRASATEMSDADVKHTFGPEMADVTVWFDPVDGIIVRAELGRSRSSASHFENGQIVRSEGTTYLVAELTAGR